MRLALCAGLLAAGLGLLEWRAAGELAKLLALGAAEPPFGPRPGSPAWRSDLERALEDLERGGEGPRIGAFDAELGWTNVAGSYLERGRQQRIGRLGTRGAGDFGAEPPPGARRIVCYGDSFTFCSEVADGEDWPAVLDALEPGIEVLNLGVPGWGLDQALLRLRRDGAALHPDVVLFGMSIDTILRHTNRLRNLLSPGDHNVTVKPRFVLLGEQLELLPQPFATQRELLAAALDGSLLERLRPHEEWVDDPTPIFGSRVSRFLCTQRALLRRDAANRWRDPDSEAFRLTLALVQRFRDEARAAGASVSCLLVFPRKPDWYYEAEPGWAEVVYWRTLREELARREIEFVDLFGVLRPLTLEQAFLEQHLSPRGNRVVAEHLRAWLAGRLAE